MQAGPQVSNSDNNGDSPDEPDDAANSYRSQYESRTDESLSTAVVKAVAEFLDTPPTDLDPLYEVVDPVVLNQAYEAINTFPDTEEDGSTTFTYSGCEVTVLWNGIIEVQSEATP